MFFEFLEGEEPAPEELRQNFPALGEVTARMHEHALSWTLPAGFMENGESTEQAAARETMEEACARVENLTLYGVFSIPHISQVYMMFRATLAKCTPSMNMP